MVEVGHGMIIMIMWCDVRYRCDGGGEATSGVREDTIYMYTRWERKEPLL